MPNITGVLIPADIIKPVQVVEFDRDDYNRINELVGGYFQVVDVPCGSVWMNEDGKHRVMATNERATQFLYDERPEFINRDVLVGDVLVLGGYDEAGNSLSVPDDVAERLIAS